MQMEEEERIYLSDVIYHLLHQWQQHNRFIHDQNVQMT